MVNNKKKGKAASPKKKQEEQETSNGGQQQAEEHPWEELLGQTLIRDGAGKETVSTAEALKGKDLVLLYFSASWCPPCQSFSPLLKQFYQHLQEDVAVELLYISSDRSVEEFETYFGAMPWLAMPLTGTGGMRNHLARTMHITGIPALIVLKQQVAGDPPLFVTDQARDQVTQALKHAKGDAAKAAAQNLARQWKDEMPAVPLNEATFEINAMAGGPSEGGWSGIWSALLKNPASIFILVYLGKLLWRQYQSYFGDSGAAPDSGAGEALVDGSADEDTEF